MDGVQIRQATPGDVEAIRVVDAAACAADEGPWTLEAGGTLFVQGREPGPLTVINSLFA